MSIVTCEEEVVLGSSVGPLFKDPQTLMPRVRLHTRRKRLSPLSGWGVGSLRAEGTAGGRHEQFAFMGCQSLRTWVLLPLGESR